MRGLRAALNLFKLNKIYIFYYVLILKNILVYLLVILFYIFLLHVSPTSIFNSAKIVKILKIQKPK